MTTCLIIIYDDTVERSASATRVVDQIPAWYKYLYSLQEKFLVWDNFFKKKDIQCICSIYQGLVSNRPLTGTLELSRSVRKTDEAKQFYRTSDKNSKLCYSKTQKAFIMMSQFIVILASNNILSLSKCKETSGVFDSFPFRCEYESSTMYYFGWRQINEQ